MARPPPSSRRNLRVAGLAGLALATTLSGCEAFAPVGAFGLPDGGAPDGGAHDGGAPDGGALDGGAHDGGVPDGGVPDGGPPDDGGAPDGGAPDGGPPPPTLDRLEVNVVGEGTVSFDGSVTCAAGTVCTYSVARGRVLSLSATPAANRRLLAWRGACAGSTSPCSITISGPTFVTAEFVPLLRTVALAPSGSGTIALSTGLTCPPSCTTTVDHGTALTLTAIPSSGYGLLGWSGDCSGTAPTCALTVTADRSVGAAFGPKLSVVAGDGGAVSLFDGGARCASACDYVVAPGASVALSAEGDVGADFVGWAGGCAGTARTCALAVGAPTSVTAVFRPTGRYLVVTVLGDGGVSSLLPEWGTPIQCGAVCAHEYPAPTPVTLYATPGSTELLLSRWSGCDAAGGASVGNLCDVQLLGPGGPNRSVQATFGPQPPGWIDACARPGMSRSFATPTDDATAFVDLPFTFTLGDRSFTRYFFSTNGVVTFDAADDSWEAAPLPRDAGAPRYGVYALWDDLETTVGNGVCTVVEGAAGTRKAVVTFSAMDFVRSSPPAQLTFSIVLEEGTNAVTVLYSELSSLGSDRALGTLGTIGLQAGGVVDQRGHLEAVVSNGTVLKLQ